MTEPQTAPGWTGPAFQVANHRPPTRRPGRPRAYTAHLVDPAGTGRTRRVPVPHPGRGKTLTPEEIETAAQKIAGDAPPIALKGFTGSASWPLGSYDEPGRRTDR